MKAKKSNDENDENNECDIECEKDEKMILCL